MLPPKFNDTLGNEEWLAQNRESIRELLPSEWVDIRDSAPMAIKAAFNFKVLGIDWRTGAEFGAIMVYLEKIGLLQRKGVLIRRNPERPAPAINPEWN